MIDLAVAQVLGGEAISDFQGLRHLTPVIGQAQLTRVNVAAASFRRHWWGLLAARPEGFPLLKVAGRELNGVTVVDLDAAIVFAASEKKNAQPTYNR